MKLTVLPGGFSVCRLEPDRPLPEWAGGGGFSSVTRTADELSVVCATDRVPEGLLREDGWSALAVEGPLDFGLTGILAALATCLAEASVPIFAVSTYDTDWILIKRTDLKRAVGALQAAGHVVVRDGVG